MKFKVEVKLKPFRVPNFVLFDKESSDPTNDTKFALADLDSDTLHKLCDQFREDVFKKAGKRH